MRLKRKSEFSTGQDNIEGMAEATRVLKLTPIPCARHIAELEFCSDSENPKQSLKPCPAVSLMYSLS